MEVENEVNLNEPQLVALVSTVSTCPSFTMEV